MESTYIKDAAAGAIETVRAAKESALDLGRTISSRLDEVKSNSAEALHSSADSVRSAADRSAAAVSRAGERVAGKLDDASSYVRGCDSLSLASSLRRAVNRNPAASLAIAVAIGFCAGTAINRGRGPSRIHERRTENE